MIDVWTSTHLLIPGRIYTDADLPPGSTLTILNQVVTPPYRFHVLASATKEEFLAHLEQEGIDPATIAHGKHYYKVSVD